MAKVFEVTYQAAGAGTDLTVQMDVFKPDKTQDVSQSGTMDEIGTTGRYYKSIIADNPNWFVEISDNAGGKALKHFGKTEYDGHGVVDLVANVQTAVDNVAAAIAVLQGLIGSVDGKVNTIDTNVDDLVTGVSALATQLGVIEEKMDELNRPPMIG